MLSRVEVLILAAVGVGGALGALGAQRFWRRWRGSVRARRRARRYLRGERDAERLLERAGYRIIDRQVARTWTLTAGGVAHEVSLRADLIVEDDMRRYVAEVKTGVDAPSIGNASTRRQLLEYRFAYEVDGILLVDPEAGAVVEVEFDAPAIEWVGEQPADHGAGAGRWLALAWVIAGAAIGAAATLALQP